MQEQYDADVEEDEGKESAYDGASSKNTTVDAAPSVPKTDGSTQTYTSFHPRQEWPHCSNCLQCGHSMYSHHY